MDVGLGGLGPFGVTTWLLTYLVHSTVVLGGVWLITRRGPLARPHHRAALWKTAGLAALGTATLQVAKPPIPVQAMVEDITRSELIASSRAPGLADGSRYRHPSTATQVRVMGVSGEGLTAACRAALRAHLDAHGGGPALQTMTPPGAADRGNASRASRRALMDRCAPSREARWPWVVLLVWLGGSASSLGGLGRRTRRFNRALVPGWPAGARIVDLLGALATKARLNRPVHVFVAPGLAGPVALSGSRIGLPPQAALLLDDDELTAALAHELGHLVRRDPAWLRTLQVLEALFWFQPLNGAARRGFQNAAEFLADAWAVRQTRRPLGLARSLEKVATWMATGEVAEPVPAMARAESPLVERVRRILGPTGPDTGRSLRSMSGVLLLPALLLPAVPLDEGPGVRIVVRERTTVSADGDRDVQYDGSRFVVRELQVEYEVSAP